MAAPMTLSIYVETAADRQHEAGYDSVGFQWGEGHIAYDQRYGDDDVEDGDEAAVADAECIEVSLADPLGTLVTACELDRSLTEPYLIIAALRKYATVRGWLLDRGHITSESVDMDCDWTPYTLEQLDFFDDDSLELLATTVGEVFGETAEAAQIDATQCSVSGESEPSYRGVIMGNVRPFLPAAEVSNATDCSAAIRRNRMSLSTDAITIPYTDPITSTTRYQVVIDGEPVVRTASDGRKIILTIDEMSCYRWWWCPTADSHGYYWAWRGHGGVYHTMEAAMIESTLFMHPRQWV